jgi:hypothetical protein
MRSYFHGKIAVFLTVVSLGFAAITMRAQSPPAMNLMPVPAKVQTGSGFLRVDEAFRLSFAGYREPRLERAAQRFLEQLHRQTALVFASRETVEPAKATLLVTTDQESKIRRARRSRNLAKTSRTRWT